MIEVVFVQQDAVGEDVREVGCDCGFAAGGEAAYADY